MGHEDRACPYCGGSITEEERNSLLCPGCLARAPRDARHCPSCAGSLRPQTLHALPGNRDCPRCAEHLRIRNLGLSAVVECAGCEGLWLSAQAFERICLMAREEPDPLAFERVDQVPPETLPPGARAYVACLNCAELMLRRQVRWGNATSGVVVDVCSRHGLWLDRDELEQVVRFLRGPGRGQVLPGQATELFTRPAPVVPAASGAGRAWMPERPPSNPVLDALRYLAEILGHVW